MKMLLHNLISLFMFIAKEIRRRRGILLSEFFLISKMKTNKKKRGQSAPEPLKREGDDRPHAGEGAKLVATTYNNIQFLIRFYHDFPSTQSSRLPSIAIAIASNSHSLYLHAIALSLFLSSLPCACFFPELCNGSDHDLRIIHGCRCGALARRGLVQEVVVVVQVGDAEAEELRRIKAREPGNAHGDGAKHRGGVRQRQDQM